MKDHLDILGESYLDLVNTPPQANVVSDCYHPTRNLRKPMNFDVTIGFARMSDMFNDVCIFGNLYVAFLDFISKMMSFDRYVFCSWSVLQRIIG
jgi:hypothetical protein